MSIEIGKRLLGVFGSALIASGALAADLPPAPAVVAPPAPPPIAAPAFDWGGFYLGIEGGYYFCGVCARWWQVGVQAGYNRVAGRILYGVNGEVGLLIGGPVYAELSGRLGLVAGRALLFADAGVGAFFVGPAVYYFQGDVGAEFALGQAISLSASLGRQKVPLGPWVWTANVGLNWRPGR